jgi:hypothetical protein
VKKVKRVKYVESPGESEVHKIVTKVREDDSRGASKQSKAVTGVDYKPRLFG